MNLDEYKSDARTLMRIIDDNTRWSVFVQLGKVRKDYTVFKLDLDSNMSTELARPIINFFKNNNCTIIKRPGNRITIKVKTIDLRPLLGLYKLNQIK